jgi:signal transduction histidine kinase
MIGRLAVRRRLTAAFIAVMAVVLATTGLFVYQRQSSSLNQAIDRALHARAADVAALAQQSDTGLAQASPRAAGAGRVQLAQLIAASGRVIDRTPGAPARPLVSPAVIAAARRGAPATLDRRLAGDQPVRLLAEPVRAQGQQLVIVVGQSLGERNLALSDLAGVLLVGGPVALLLSSAMGYLLTGAALRPVERMRREAASISVADLDQRLPSAGGNDELGRLGRTLNEMLTRIHAAVERERALVSDASHELRTPLAVLRTELELIGRERPSGPALQSAIASAIEETDRLTEIADSLLLLARADEGRLVLDAAPVPAAELMHEAAGRARRHPEAAGAGAVVVAVFDVEAPEDVSVLADRERAVQALENLLANAVRHADARVELSARRAGRAVELHVTDDGAGFGPDFLPHAFERFARADASRTGEGAGLGLAIVHAIAEAHGGDAHAVNAPAGGADVWISLPAALHACADAPDDGGGGLGEYLAPAGARPQIGHAGSAGQRPRGRDRVPERFGRQVTAGHEGVAEVAAGAGDGGGPRGGRGPAGPWGLDDGRVTEGHGGVLPGSSPCVCSAVTRA